MGRSAAPKTAQRATRNSPITQQRKEILAPTQFFSSLLGHSTPDITREIYLHAIPEEQRRAVEDVERLVFGPKWTQVQAPTQTTSGRVN